MWSPCRWQTQTHTIHPCFTPITKDIANCFTNIKKTSFMSVYFKQVEINVLKTLPCRSADIFYKALCVLITVLTVMLFKLSSRPAPCRARQALNICLWKLCYFTRWNDTGWGLLYVTLSSRKQVFLSNYYRYINIFQTGDFSTWNVHTHDTGTVLQMHQDSTICYTRTPAR